MTNSQLINGLIKNGLLKTPSIIKAFKNIDRKDFVLPEYKENPYEDHPLPIGFGGTISQPTTVAFMLELLQPMVGNKILDIGSGSGWTTALLAELVGKQGKVFGVEIIPELVEFGKDNLSKYSFKQAVILQAKKGELGLKEKAPFDKILVSASVKELNKGLVSQFKIGGRLVIPIKNSLWQIDKISKTKLRKTEFPGFVFVPLQQV